MLLLLAFEPFESTSQSNLTVLRLANKIYPMKFPQINKYICITQIFYRYNNITRPVGVSTRINTGTFHQHFKRKNVGKIPTRKIRSFRDSPSRLFPPRGAPLVWECLGVFPGSNVCHRHVPPLYFEIVRGFCHWDGTRVDDTAKAENSR